MKKILFLFLFLFSYDIFSQSLYLGVKGTYADWQVGPINSLNHTTSLMSLINSAAGFFNINDNNKRKDYTFFNIEKKRANMYLTGVSGSYVSDRWSINYFGTYGNSRFRAKEFTSDFSNGSYKDFPPNTTAIEEQVFLADQNIRVRRYDHDLSFSRLIGDTSFFFFTGLKFQGYNYSGTTGLKPQYDKIYLVENSETAYPKKFTETSFSFNTNFKGPALGLGYSFPITEKQGFTLSVGLVYLTGNLLSEIKYGMYKYQEFSSFKNSGIDMPEFFLKEKIAAKGYTFEATYINKITDNFLLRAHFMHQATKFESLNIDHNLYNYSINSYNNYSNMLFIPISAIGDKNKFAHSGYHNAKDVFNGISFSVLYRLNWL